MGTSNLIEGLTKWGNELVTGETDSQNLGKFCDLIEELWAMTADYLPKPEDIERRAKAWRKLLTDHFFRAKTDYVIVCVCRIRGERRDAIKADEILRVAEKVYGCPVSMWSDPDAGSPEVWSTRENDWIPLSQALERLWFQYPHRADIDNPPETRVEEQTAFEAVRPELLKAIYGEGV